MRVAMLRWAVAVLLCLCTSIGSAAPNVAFFYGAFPPWDELQAFDVVVVEPAYVLDPGKRATERMQVFAYVSVGEVEYRRPYAADLPQGTVAGANETWRSHVIDQTHPEWPQFFLDRILTPLWRAGFRGFFLDTLDSFHLIAKTDEAREAQAQALVALVRALRARFPAARLIFNRGFEVLPHVHEEVFAVAAESIYRGWDPKVRQYVEVTEADRTWLLGQLRRVQNEYGLPVIAIDYASPGERELARATARRISGLGFVPWITNAEHDLLGVGNVEVAPRKVLMVYDGSGRDAQLYAHRIQKQAKLPLTMLGYEVDYADVNKSLPAYPLVGRYAGIVTWFSNDQAVHKAGVREWLVRQREHGVRMAVLGSFPFPLSDSLALTFGLSAGPQRVPKAVNVEVRDPLIEYANVLDAPVLFTPLRANRAQATLLRLRSDSGETMDAAALMPWGGYVLAPYDSASVPGTSGERWLIEPMEFMRRALALPRAPDQGAAVRTQQKGGPGETIEYDASERPPIPSAS
jgi:uncharacterized protein (TIGR01370 family)